MHCTLSNHFVAWQSRDPIGASWNRRKDQQLKSQLTAGWASKMPLKSLMSLKFCQPQDAPADHSCRKDVLYLMITLLTNLSSFAAMLLYPPVKLPNSPSKVKSDEISNWTLDSTSGCGATPPLRASATSRAWSLWHWNCYCIRQTALSAKQGQRSVDNISPAAASNSGLFDMSCDTNSLTTCYKTNLPTLELPNALPGWVGCSSSPNDVHPMIKKATTYEKTDALSTNLH